WAGGPPSRTGRTPTGAYIGPFPLTDPAGSYEPHTVGNGPNRRLQSRHGPPEVPGVRFLDIPRPRGRTTGGHVADSQSPAHPRGDGMVPFDQRPRLGDHPADDRSGRLLRSPA